MLKKTIALFFLVLAFASCDFFNSKEKDDRDIVAKVNDSFMFKDDLKMLMPKHYVKKDSIIIARNIINNWAKRQLLIHKAKLNLNDNTVEIDALVNKYKQNLLIDKYREAVVLQHLDTLVNEVDIENYYANNKAIFMLNEGLVQLKFIQVSKNIANKNLIIKRFKSNKQEDIDLLLKDEMAYKSLHFNDSIWIKYSDVLKFIPVLKSTEFIKIKNNSYIELQDSKDLYMIRINKKLNRNTISPKSYVLPTIKRMILHTRKLELIKNIEQTLLNDANKNGEYENYK